MVEPKEKLQQLFPKQSELPDPHEAFQEFQVLLQEAEGNATPKHIPWWHRFGLTPVRGFAVACCLLLLPVSAKLLFFSTNTSNPDLLRKGSSTWSFYHAKRREDGTYQTPNRITQHAVLSPKDMVQFSSYLPKKTHLMVVSLNEKYEFFTYFPFRKQHSKRVKKGLVKIPGTSSFELDDILGKEVFYFVTSSQSFTLTDVKHRLKAKGRLSKEKNYIKLFRFVIQKKEAGK